MSSIDSKGYLREWSTVDGVRKKTLVHRRVFLEHYGYLPDIVDHINGNKLDNRPINLRPASYSENACNSKLNSKNTSGVKGIAWIEGRNRWRASITKDGKCCSKSFVIKEHAIIWLNKTREELHGEFCKR